MRRRKLSAIAKLTCPRAEGLFSRERLFAELDKSDRPLTWIEGPPGAGKTSLVVAWLRSRDQAYVWYQIEVADGSPETLFHYLSVAAEAAPSSRSRTPARALPKLDDARNEELDRFSRRFFRAFFARLPRDSIVIFDNYQDARPQEHMHEILRRAVEELPLTLRIAVLSRDPLPPALSRLRAQQRVRVVGWPELRFTAQESAAMIRARLPAGIAAGAANIHERTGGWAGGLILTLEHIERYGHVEVQAPGLGMEELFDYFTTQVLADVGAGNTDLLLRMSYLPHFTAEDAVAITGQRGSVALLQNFSRRNLFIEARRVAQQPSYQFHALFRDFLQLRARTRFRRLEHSRLSKTAGRLLEAAGDYDSAFSLYERCGAHVLVRRLIHENAEKLFRHGRRTTLLGWIEVLPRELRTGDPWLSYWHALATLGISPTQTRAQLETAHHQFATCNERDGQLLAAAAAADSFFSDPSSWTGVDPWIERLHELLADSSIGRDAARARATMSLMRALLYRLPGDERLASLAAALEEVVDAPFTPDVRVACAGVLLAYYWWRGNASAMHRVEQRTQAEARNEDIAVSTRLYYMFWVAVEACKIPNVEKIQALVQQAREMVDDTGLAPLSVELERFIAAALLIRGEAGQARAFMAQRLAPSVAQSRPVARAWYHNTLAACDVAEGGLGEARRNIDESLALVRAADNTLAELLTAPLAAFVHVESGNLQEADRILVDLTARAQNPRSNFEAKALRAYAELKSDRPVCAAELRDLVEYMRSQDYLPLYSWAPFVTVRLLSAAAQQPDLQSAVQEIVARFDLRCSDFALEPWPWPVRVTTLGKFELSSSDAGGPSASKSARKLLQLFQVLIAAGPEGATNHGIVDLLWPQTEGDTARKNLEVSLYRLRQLLGRQEVVVSRYGRIQIERSLCWVDAWAFEEAAERILATREEPDWASKAERTVQLYRGDFLEGETDAAWVLAARARLRRLWARLVAELCARWQTESKWQAVAQLTERALEIDPDGEDNYRRLMTAQFRMGDGLGAMRTFDRCRAWLAAERGMEPSQQTLELHSLISERGL